MRRIMRRRRIALRSLHSAVHRAKWHVCGADRAATARQLGCTSRSKCTGSSAQVLARMLAVLDIESTHHSADVPALHCSIADSAQCSCSGPVMKRHSHRKMKYKQHYGVCEAGRPFCRARWQRQATLLKQSVSGCTASKLDRLSKA